MKRLHIFLIVLVTTVGVLVSLAAVAWYFAASSPSSYRSSWMGQMWGGMGGGMMGGGGTSAGTSSYLWVVPVLLIAASAVAVIGVIFYLVFPELRFIRGTSCSPQKPESVPVQVKTTETTATVPSVSNVSPVSSNLPVSNSCEVLLKTMTPEEQKVLNVLINHKGKYLQKYVGKEAGLSRLKTHRIIARFAQRGIVTITQFGNTNEVLLAEWVKPDLSNYQNS